MILTKQFGNTSAATALFPGLKSRTTFVRQAANLSQYKGFLQQRLAGQLGTLVGAVHLIDGIAIPLCCYSRALGCRSFKGEAAYSYCAAKQQTYYGFRSHLLISVPGVIAGFSLTPASGSEREALWDWSERFEAY